MVKRHIRFTFKKSARTKAIKALESLEGGSLIGAVAGAYGADPVASAWLSLGFFLVCRVTAIVIAGIEDDVEPRRRERSTSNDDEEA